MSSLKTRAIRIALKTSWPTRLWLTFFGVWMVLLSGGFSGFENGVKSTRERLADTAPGLLQYWRLQSMRTERMKFLEKLQNEIAELETEQVLLTQSPAAQERAIRKTLGYVREDEILVDWIETRAAHPKVDEKTK